MNSTGERMMPESSDPDTFWEHLYRYAFAAKFAGGRRILDVACGAGYGSAALKEAGASHVIGIDLSVESCQFAASRYRVDARVGNAEKLPLANGTIDLFVSFETIEHLAHPLRFLDECQRVLAPGGRAIISTPNKPCYRKITAQNPFHAHEFDRAEFERECRRRFAQVVLYSQRPFDAPWWSPRGLAAISWRGNHVRGMNRLSRELKHRLHSHLQGGALRRAREYPVEAILSLRSKWLALGNPYSIRPAAALALDNPLYLIAACSKPR